MSFRFLHNNHGMRCIFLKLKQTEAALTVLVTVDGGITALTLSAVGTDSFPSDVDKQTSAV